MTPRVLDLRIKSFFSIWGVLYVAPWLIVLLSVFAICNFAVAQKAPMQRPDGQIEPTYKSQPLSHWIEVLNGGHFSSKFWPDINEIEGGAEAQQALEHIGGFAVPFLLERIPERGAMVAFRVLGPRARSAIPELVAMTTNEIAAAPTLETSRHGVSAIGWYPMQVLGWIGPDALPALSIFLTNYNDPGVRFSAVMAVGSMGTNGRPALPAVFPCVKDGNEMVAREAISVLGLMGRDPAVFQALTDALQLRPDLKSETLEGLAKQGEEAVPIIARELPKARSGAKYIVGNTFIQKSPEVLTNRALLAVVSTQLQSEDSDAREWAALMLRAADAQSRGQRPRPLWDAVGGWAEARANSTNVLHRLAPELGR